MTFNPPSLISFLWFISSFPFNCRAHSFPKFVAVFRSWFGLPATTFYIIFLLPLRLYFFADFFHS
jgi:hypothetical protein